MQITLLKLHFEYFIFFRTAYYHVFYASANVVPPEALYFRSVHLFVCVCMDFDCKYLQNDWRYRQAV